MVYLLSTRVDLNFPVHKLSKFLSNPGKVHFEGLVHLLGYISYNKTLGLKHYAYMDDSPLSDLLRQSNIKNENQLMAFYYFIWKYRPDTGIRIGAYNIFY